MTPIVFGTDEAFEVADINTAQAVTVFVDRLRLRRVTRGSGIPARWTVWDVLVLAFAKGLVPGMTGGHRQTTYENLTPLAKLAAREYLTAECEQDRPGWLTIDSTGEHAVWPLDSHAELAEWLLEHGGAVQVLRCQPIYERLQRVLERRSNADRVSA